MLRILDNFKSTNKFKVDTFGNCFLKLSKDLHERLLIMSHPHIHNYNLCNYPKLKI